MSPEHDRQFRVLFSQIAFASDRRDLAEAFRDAYRQVRSAMLDEIASGEQGAEALRAELDDVRDEFDED